MSEPKICCIFNLAPHYREPIYTLMDEKLNCDFYFGDKVKTKIKPLNVNNLKGYKNTVKNKFLFNTGWIWQKGVSSLVFKPYDFYIITGDPYIISNYVILLLSHLLNKKVFVWSHGMKANANTKRKLLEFLFFKLSHKVLIYGEYSQSIMLKRGFKKDKLIPIYNSLNYDQQKRIRENLGSSTIYKDHFKNGKPVLAYIGRIQHSKKLDLLLRATKDLLNKGTPCNLVFIGKDVEEVGLEKLAMDLDIQENVWFYGASYDEEDIGNLIFNANVCISPGPIGLTALHSLTYGTPIITNDNFETQMPEFEIIEKGKTGDFFIDNDIKDLTLKTSQWISLDETKRNSVRKWAFEAIDKYYNPHYQIKVLKKLVGIN
ncbi:MAG: glycosyltransferase [Flavobacteriaceae bacterium]